MLTASIALSLWAFLRAIEIDDDQEEPRGRTWALVLAASLGVSLLLKSLIGVVFPVGAAIVYLAVTRQLFDARIWKRLHPFSGVVVVLLIAAPWHILATLRNPPYFDFTMHSAPGEYHGFLWFYFINEQLLRFLNLRYPRDYNTVPRIYFWLLHFAWLFPWSVYLPAALRLNYRPIDRAGKTRLLALCWTGFVLVFFTFSTTQEYYSMPCYPALALLIGSAMAAGGAWVRRGTRVLCAILAVCGRCGPWFVFRGEELPTPGDISSALSAASRRLHAVSWPYGGSDAHRRSPICARPLLLAGIAFLLGAAGTLRATGQRAFLAAAVMVVLFFQAARMALVVFDPYMSSRPLAEALLHSPPGKLIGGSSLLHVLVDLLLHQPRALCW